MDPFVAAFLVAATGAVAMLIYGHYTESRKHKKKHPDE